MQITGGVYNSRKIKTADYDNIKPTLSKTRQGIFNTLASMFDFKGKVFYDLFAGSGIMGLEAISRGFEVVCFEKDKKTALALQESYKSLNLKANLYFGDALKNIVKLGSNKADVIFVDPPYESDLYEKALEVIINNNILNPQGIIILEHPADKIINHEKFNLIKTKTYGNKQITYLSLI